MQGAGRAQQKRKNKRIISTDKRNNRKTEDKYRHDNKQNRSGIYRKGQYN